jgi:hypothetical protein
VNVDIKIKPFFADQEKANTEFDVLSIAPFHVVVLVALPLVRVTILANLGLGMQFEGGCALN